MADGTDLLADDVQDLTQETDNESVDLYDDVDGNFPSGDLNPASGPCADYISSEPTLNYTLTDGSSVNGPIKRFQLYVGNLTWWTSDQDITDAVHDIGVDDFLDVKFFEDRATGQSKGFCVISLASESVMRTCMNELPKKKLNGQCPVVTYPTIEALNQFEAQSKTRVVPPPQSNFNEPQQGVLPSQMNNTPRIMVPHQQQQQPPFRNGLPAPGMHGAPQMQLVPRMHRHPHNAVQRIPLNSMPNYQRLPGYFWAPQPCMMIRAMPIQNQPLRPGMFQGPQPVQRMPQYPNQGGTPQTRRNDPRVSRSEWNHPAGLPVNSMPVSAQGPPPQQQLPSAPHINPKFFQQSQDQNWHHVGQDHGSQSSSGPHGGANETREHHGAAICEQEFEEIMSRNRTVSSSAITKAVTDAAAGDYASAIKTLVTAISLIKESKVSEDERCKILISSLRVTLDGVEAESYRRDREESRSRDRERYHKHSRRDRSRSRDYRERSRERDRYEREKERRHYDDRHRERDRQECRIVRDRERDRYEQRREYPRRSSRR